MVERYQRIVNETQLPRLNKMTAVLNEDILESSQNFTYVVIDELDRDWVDEGVSNSLIRCLFRAVMDLKRVRNLKVLVSLRTNMFEHLDFGAKTGGQEEKFRSLTLQIRWTRAELEGLLAERARTAARYYCAPNIESLRDLIPASNSTRGNIVEFIIRRTLMRPRDAIAYFNEALSLAGGSPRITWDHVIAAEDSYSKKRLLALRDEWKPTFPGIEKVFRSFSGAPAVMSRDEYRERLEDVALLIMDHFEGVDWLSALAEPFWHSESRGWAEVCQPLTQFLYGIGFIGITKNARKRSLFAYDDPDFANRASNLELLSGVSVHPAFRVTLDIANDRFVK